MAVDLGRRPGRWRHRLAFVVTVLATLLAVFATQLPAAADPGTDSEGQSAALNAKLEAAAKSYYDIKVKLTASQKRQADIKKKLEDAQLSLLRLSTVVSNIAAARYKGGQVGILDGLITGEGDPHELLQAGAVAEYLIWRDDDQLRQYRQAQEDAKRNQDLLTAEIANEKKQYAELDRAKRSAEGPGRGGWSDQRRFRGQRGRGRPTRAAQRRRQLPQRVLYGQRPDLGGLHQAPALPRADRGAAGRVQPVHALLAPAELGRAPARPGL